MKKSRSRHSKGMHHHSLNCLLFLGDSTKGVKLDVAQGLGYPYFVKRESLCLAVYCTKNFVYPL